MATPVTQNLTFNFIPHLLSSVTDHSRILQKLQIFYQNPFAGGSYRLIDPNQS